LPENLGQALTILILIFVEVDEVCSIGIVVMKRTPESSESLLAVKQLFNRAATCLWYSL
jgi:hypothetical protein